jgi:uncharacterized phage protein gp47/JayE
MAATLAELTTPTTEAQELSTTLTALSAAGFPVTSWQDGDVALTLTRNQCRALSEYTTLRAAIAAGGLLRAALAAGLTDWLTLLAEEVYAITRNPAVATKGTIRLTAAADAGPYTITPGQLRATSTGGLRYQSANTANVTLAKGGTLDVTFQAETPGAAYNVANGTITTLATPLAGVTCANPDPGSGTWTTTSGVDAESDAALVSRCEARWPESGFGSPAGSYDLWARTADPTITRTKVAASGTVAGQVDVYVAGASGPVGAGAVTNAQTYITPRAPLNVTAVVANTSALALTITAALYGKAQYQTAALAAATAAITALVAGTAIGGTIYGSAKIAALKVGSTVSPVIGVENVVIGLGGGDTALTAAQVATLTLNLTWTNT